MTTDTSTAAATAAVTTAAVTDVRAAEVARLDAAVAASTQWAALLTPRLAAAQATLKAATDALTILQQQVSTLLQQLAAATTGVERHTVHEAIDAVLLAQRAPLRQQLDAADEVASLTLAVRREAARVERLKGDLGRAQADQVTARADAAAPGLWTAQVGAAVKTIHDGAAALDGRVSAAEARLGVLLGSPDKLALVRQRLATVDAGPAARAATVATAVAGLRAAVVARSPVDGAAGAAAADLAAARSAIQDAVVAAPVRLDAVSVVLDAVAAFPPLNPVDQAAIAALADGPGADPAKWDVAIPQDVTGLAIALIDAEAVRVALQGLDADALVKAVHDAETACAAALSTQLAATAAQTAASEAVDAARDELAAPAATTDLRRTAAARGDV